MKMTSMFQSTQKGRILYFAAFVTLILIVASLRCPFRLGIVTTGQVETVKIKFKKLLSPLLESRNSSNFSWLRQAAGTEKNVASLEDSKNRISAPTEESKNDYFNSFVLQKKRLDDDNDDENCNGDDFVSVRFHLKQKSQLNIDWLEQRLYQISDPIHHDYGKWMTIAELTNYIAPSETTMNGFLDWLDQVYNTNTSSHSTTSSKSTRRHQTKKQDLYYRISPTNDSVLVRWKLKTFMRVFSREIDLMHCHSFKGKSSSTRSLTGVRIVIPKDIESIVEFVRVFYDSNGNEPSYFPKSSSFLPSLSRRSRRTTSSVSFLKGEGCDVTPDIIYKTYNLTISSGLPRKSSDILVSQSVAEFEEAYFYPNDLRVFEQKFNLPDQNVTKIVGKNIPDEGYLGEASLDTQYIVAAAPRVPTWVMSQYEYDIAEWVETILSFGDNAPRVHSFSWGTPEMKYHDSWLQRSNKALMKLSLLGHSVLVASGDEGAGNSGFFRCKRFQPYFPATSPFVTAVGGTYLDTDTNEEIGWKNSGGGFSDRFMRPPYQRKAVETYMDQLQEQNLLPPSKLYNSSGNTRAIPDVAALATNYQVVIENFTGDGLSGTSAAAPTFAGFVSRLNQQRLEAGKPVLGFLNPILYQLKKNCSSCFRNITRGNSRPSFCHTGWSAESGWSAITGIGTPNVGELLEQIRSLP